MENGPPMSAARVVAAVVTYNPGDDLAQNLRSLRMQASHVVVIDNGSTNFEAVRQAAAEADCELVANGANLGVATALNQGAAKAFERGAEWFAMFDQDSLLPEGAIDGVLACHEAHPQRDRIGMVGVSHRDRGTQADYHNRLDILEETPEWRLLRVTITSGSLVRCDVLREVGLFEDRLFIDSVDHEFCLRMRRKGWLLMESRGQVMAHSIGASTAHRLLGFRLVCTHHSALRRYYITRNLLEVGVRNLWFDPTWSIKSLWQLAAGDAAAVLYERDKLAKLRAVLVGVAHFAVRRFGPRH
jgi:rhamnosyltransferase